MKKLIICLFLLATPLFAQFEKGDVSVEKNGGNPVVAGGAAVQPYSGTPVLGDIIYFNGTNWVSLGKPADGTYSITFSSSIPAWQAGGAGIGTDTIWTAAGQLAYGTGTHTATVLAIGGAHTLLHGGATSPAYSGVDLTSDVGATVLPVANGGTGVATATVHGVMLGNAGSAQNVTAAGATGQHLVGNDSADPTWETSPYDLTKWEIINTSFWQHGATAGAAIINAFNITVTGASAGYQTAPGETSPSPTPDANHPNFAEIMTGSTTTGGATLGPGVTSTAGINGGFLVTGGEIVDWLIWVPTVSGGTNTHRIYVGLADTTGNAVPTNGLFVTWDNNSNTHWAVQSTKASSSTGPTASTTVATATAWHHIKIVVNSNATSVQYFVDGSELSSSPLTTNIPTTVPVFPEVKIVASAGCSSITSGNAANCAIDVNTVYFRKSVSR